MSFIIKAMLFSLLLCSSLAYGESSSFAVSEKSLVKSPHFEGWYMRLSDKDGKRSVAVVGGSFMKMSGTLLPKGPLAGYLAVIISDGPGFPTTVFEAFPKNTTYKTNGQAVFGTRDLFSNSTFYWEALGLDLLGRLKEVDQHLFFESLYALCGFGHSEIIQVNCFHQDYDLKSIDIKNFDDTFKKANKECVLLPIKDLASSVEIVIGNVVLQVRVKPMNKFTTAAYKINCSIKVKA